MQTYVLGSSPESYWILNENNSPVINIYICIHIYIYRYNPSNSSTCLHILYIQSRIFICKSIHCKYWCSMHILIIFWYAYKCPTSNQNVAKFDVRQKWYRTKSSKIQGALRYVMVPLVWIQDLLPPEKDPGSPNWSRFVRTAAFHLGKCLACFLLRNINQGPVTSNSS